MHHDVEVRHPEPRPYQLKPTLNTGAPADNYTTGSPDTQSPTSPMEKEAEVNALTNLLMQNMEAAADPDFFGTSTSSSCVLISQLWFDAVSNLCGLPSVVDLMWPCTGFACWWNA